MWDYHSVHAPIAFRNEYEVKPVEAFWDECSDMIKTVWHLIQKVG